MRQLIFLLALCVRLACPAFSFAASIAEPAFVAGYAAAVLDEFGVAAGTATVTATTVTVWARGLSVPDKEGLSRALLRVQGMTAVMFPPDPRIYPLNDYGRGRWATINVRASSGAATAHVPRSGWTAFPKRFLFDPLIADPREPRFSGRMLRYKGGAAGLNRVWAADFGGSFALLGADLRGDGLWQFGAQGNVFTLWNLDTISDDHITADFLVGLPVTWRWDRLSMMARLYHVSTHLGDEFVLTHADLARVNLSYEAFDLKLSYSLHDALRVYAGAGRMLRRNPTETRPASLQAGAEFTFPKAYWKGLLRPVVALDLQKHEKSGWAATDVSLRLGTQIENRTKAARRILLLVEYYRGKDPNGQFFMRTIEYTGLGLHVYF